MPREEVILCVDPRRCQYGELWKDCIREQLNLVEYALEIAWVSLVRDGKKTKLFGYPCNEITWDEAVKIFEEEHPVIELRPETGDVLRAEEGRGTEEWWGDDPDNLREQARAMREQVQYQQ